MPPALGTTLRKLWEGEGREVREEGGVEGKEERKEGLALGGEEERKEEGGRMFSKYVCV
jgi:hypothetical protein